MTGRYTQADHEQFRKEQDERAAKEEEARNARMEKENARRAWKADGGSEVDFEKAWPALRDAARKERVLNVGRAAREAMRNGTTSRI